MSGPILITGAAGFAGGYLLQRLAGRHDLVAWARSTPNPEISALARWQQVDLLDRERVRTAISETKPAAVYHLAGATHVGESFAEPAKALAGNILATHHLFDALRRESIACRIVVTGSATVYGWSEQPLTEDSPIGPGSPYGVSKFAQEQLGLRALVEDGLDVIVTRPFNHTGPRQPPAFMAPSVARQIALIERGQLAPVLKIGNTTPKRDLTDVRDVVRAYDLLMQSGTPGVIYNVASGIGRSVREILDALLTRSTVSVRTEVDPALLRSNDPPMLVGDPSRLMQATGWHPEIPFGQTMDDLLDYWRHAVAA